MPSSNSRVWLAQLWELARFVISVLIIVIPIRTWVAKPFIVSGASMYPTFENSDYLIIDELTYHFRPPERGEVVVFRFPKDESKFFIKRVIGLPGETVTIKGSEVTITKPDGTSEKLQEPYLKELPALSTDLSLKLGPAEYFVLGDNRNVSYDSRAWGTVPADLITGRAFLRLFPPTRLGFLPGADTTTNP